MTAANVWGISGNWAEIYHACFVPSMIAPWAERTLALAALNPVSGCWTWPAAPAR
ncbi:hypothetical protein [Candidatus Amarolinea dominans]|uniref:hypothetical protein n=1 Tax=Candidatus Amarolinea dominans TaxID=3140696 RepID=UPI001DD055A7|nr:hypothetical protein [Anaerolineae bacterium]